MDRLASKVSVGDVVCFTEEAVQHLFADWHYSVQQMNLKVQMKVLALENVDGLWHVTTDNPTPCFYLDSDFKVIHHKETKMSQLSEQQAIVKQMTNIVRIFKASKGMIRPHFMLTGPSGSGKSFLTEELADDNDLNFMEINAAQLTKEGTAGNSLSKALTPLTGKTSTPTLVFVDEFDKLFISGNTNSSLAHETTNGVQNEFLKVLESKTTSVYGEYGKYHDVNISNVLFVFAGAFNGEENLTVDRLRDFGIKVEFLGRVGLVYNLQKLSLDSMKQALIASPLLARYLKLFTAVQKETVIDALMPYIEQGHDKNTLGIRIINTLLHQYFVNDGKLPENETKNVSFQTTLTLGA